MNKIKAIRSDQDYEEALTFLETLIIKDPAPGSEESINFSILSTLIESYETTNFLRIYPTQLQPSNSEWNNKDLRPVDLVPFVEVSSF